MSKTEYDNFGHKLAFHTAPTLLGIKCASLVSVSSAEFDLGFHTGYFNRKAASKGLKSRILCCGNRALMLVFSVKLPWQTACGQRCAQCSFRVRLSRKIYAQ